MNRTGRVDLVKKAVVDDFKSQPPCSGPEEVARLNTAQAIDAILGGFPTDRAVKVEAHGMQWSPWEGNYVGALSVKVEQLPGFISE